MKIAIVHPSLEQRGGAERIVACLYRELRHKGHHVDVFTMSLDPRAWPEDTFGEQDIHIVKTGAVKSIINSKTLTSRLIGLALRRRLRDYDIVNPHNYPSTDWVYSATRRMNPRPFCVWYCQEPSRKIHWQITDEPFVDYIRNRRNSNEYGEFFHAEYDSLVSREIRKKKKLLRDRKRDREAIRHMDLILANSRFTMANLRKLMPEDHGNLHVCYLGVDLSDDPHVNESEKEDYVLAVAPLVMHKNPITIIEAIRLLAKKNTLKVKVKLIGEGKQGDLVDDLIQKYALADHVEVIRWVPDEELRVMMKKAALILYIPICEPFGLVPLESMALGTPVIVSNHGGPTETVVDGVTGLWADPFSPEDVAEKCRYLLENQAARERMGEEGRDFVRQFFSKERFIEEFENHLFKLTGLRDNGLVQ